MSQTFCPLPWIFLAIRNNGSLRICCQSNVSASQGLIRDENGQIYNARSANIKDSRNAELMRSTRQKMLQGEWSENCIRCKQEEENGLSSRRHYELDNWSLRLPDVLESTDDDGTIDTEKFPIKYIDLRFGNKCNLACRMCGPSDSDAWYTDYVKLTGSPWFKDTEGKVELTQREGGKKWQEVTPSYTWYESQHFWQELKENSQQVAHIYLAGGEPLLIEEHYTFLSHCIEQDIAKQIIIEYNTNATYFPERVLEMWSKFKQIRLGLSIDGIGSVLEYQRYPAKWSLIEKNLYTINDKIASSPNIYAWIACTVTMYNVFHLADFVEWKLTAGLSSINTGRKKPILSFHMAHKPEHLNIKALPQALKISLQHHYDRTLERIKANYDENYFKAAKKIFDTVIKYAMSGDLHEQKWQDFVDNTTKLDKFRQQDYKDVLPYHFSLAIERTERAPLVKAMKKESRELVIASDEDVDQSFCAYPYFHLQYKPNGVVKPCCRYEVKEAISANKQMSVLEHENPLYSNYWHDLRKQMSKDVKPSGCQECFNEEKLGLTSLRINKRQANKMFSADVKDLSLQYLEVGFSNQCNLACRTCTSSLSTKWFDDDQYLLDHNFKRDAVEIKHTQVDDSKLDHIDYKKLKTVKFTGGEPFMHPQLETFLQRLIDADNVREIQLNISSNTTFVPKASLLDKLKQFNKVNINTSIDGYGSYNDYIRSPAQWTKVEETLKFWRETVSSKLEWQLTLAATVSVYSITGLPPLLKWWQDFTSGERAEAFSIVYQIASYPTYISPSIVPATLVNELFNNQNYEFRKYFTGRQASSENINEFLRYTKLLDAKRNESFAQTFPELSRGLESYNINNLHI